MFRCPACGQRLESPLPRLCSLCQYDFGDDRVTGADVTPYAKAYTHHKPGWWEMTKWTWFAEAGRLKHLALMRTSAASRRYARVNVLLLAFLLGLLQWARVGWSGTTEAIGVNPSSVLKPDGDGWFHVASAPRPLPPDRAIELPVDLWWNPAQSMIAVSSGMVVSWMLILLVLVLLRKGVTKAHHLAYRREQRMTAAILYGTAWSFWLMVASVIFCLIPAAYIGEMKAWSWYPTENGFILMVAILAGTGSTLWWIWLIRLGASAPVNCRGQVVAFMAPGTPIIIAAAVCAWRYGLDVLYDVLFPLINLSV